MRDTRGGLKIKFLTTSGKKQIERKMVEEETSKMCQYFNEPNKEGNAYELHVQKNKEQIFALVVDQYISLECKGQFFDDGISYDRQASLSQERYYLIARIDIIAADLKT